MAKTEPKSKTVSYQFIEYSSMSNFIRSTYPFFAVHILPFKIDYLKFVRERKCVNNKRGYGNKI